MTSPYLERPLRPRHVVVAELLANMSDTYLVVDMMNGEPFLWEAELSQSFNRVVRDMIEGQYDCKGEAPVAVLRISRDAPAEDVTQDVVAEIIKRLNADHSLAFDGEGYLKPFPFLDNACPDWESQLPLGRVDPPEYEREDAA